MPEFTGTVEKLDTDYAFKNEDGTGYQRLTAAKLGEIPVPQELDLAPYDNKRIKVRGDCEYDWIFEAEILDAEILDALS